jgi:hypothetical protein
LHAIFSQTGRFIARTSCGALCPRCGY